MATYSAGSASIDISPNLSGFAEELRSRLEAIDANVRVDLDLDTAAAQARIDAITRGRNMELRVDLDDAAAEARLAALTRDRRVRVDVDGGGLTGLRSQADGATNSLSRMSGLRFTGLATGIAALIPVLLGVAGAAGGAVAALGAIGAAGVVGSQGVVGAFQAIKQQSEETGSSASNNANQIANAQDGVRDALRGVTEAQRGVEDAQRDAASAQTALNDAYGEAARELRDMNDQLKDAELNQESAAIAVARARERAQQVRADPKSSQLDVVEADFRVREAQQRYQESITKTQDQRVDTGKANAAGVSGSKTVKDAQDNAVSANERVVQAQQRVVEAQEAVVRAQRSLADANNSASSSADKVAAAMAKLSPSAQAFVRDIQSLGPVWNQFRSAVQENLFGALGTSVGDFARTNLPAMQQGLGAIAGTLGGTVKDTLQGLTAEFQQLTNSGEMQKFVQGVQQSLSGAAPFFTGFTNMMVQLGATVGPTLGPLFASFGTFFREMAPGLGTIGAAFNQMFTAVLPVLGQFIGALSAGLAPVLPVLGQLLNALFTALTPLIAPLSQILQILGTALAQALPIVAPFFANLATVIGQLLAAVAPLLPPLLQLASAILTPIVGIISAVVQALAPFIQQLAAQLQPVIAAITPILAQVGSIIGQAMTQALQQLTPLMGPLIQAFLQLVQALLPLLPPIAQLAVSLLPLMIQYYSAIIPVITEAITVFTQIAIAVMPLVVGAINAVISVVQALANPVQAMGTLWGTVMDGVKTAVGGARDWIVDRFNDVVGFVTGLGDRLKNAAGGIWNFLLDGLKDRIHDIGKILAAINIKIPDWVPGVGGQEFGFKSVGEAMQRLSTGGQVTGPGTGTSDSIIGIGADGIPTARVSNGEFVVNADATAKYLPLLNALNRGLPGFASGGQVGAGDASRAMDFARSMDPVPYLMGGFSRQNIDCSGMVSAVVNVLQGRDPFDDRMSTPSEGTWLTNRGFQLGTGSGSDVQIGWYDQGGGANGHTAMAIQGTNIESNGDEGVVIGGRTGPLASMFTDHAFMKIGSNAPLGQPTLAPGATNLAQPGSTTADQTALNASTNATTTTTGSAQPFALQTVLGKAGEALGTAILSGLGLEDSIFSSSNPYNKAVTDIANRPTSAGSSTTGNAPQATVPTPTPTPAPAAPAVAVIASTGNPVKDAVKAALKPRGWDTGAEWDAVDYIVGKESGWNPTATNPSSGAFGLFQFLGSTLSTYLPDRSSDPNKQGVAGGRYIGDRYQTPTRAREFWQSHQWYADGGPVIGAGGPRDDLIPAFLSNGEFVVNAPAAQRNLPALQAINSGSNITGGSSVDRSAHVHIAGNAINVQDIVDAVNQAQAYATIGTV